MFPMRCRKALPPCSLRPKNTPKAYPHIMLKNLFTSPPSRPRQMVDIQCGIAIMGGREVSRPYRVWFFAEGECFLCFCFCAPSIYPLNHKDSSNKHFVRWGDKKIVLRFTSWHNSYLTFIWGLNISCLLYIVCYSRNAMGRMQRTFTFVFHIFPASHRGIFLITRTASLSRAS